jgi:hypothetical protein
MFDTFMAILVISILLANLIRIGVCLLNGSDGGSIVEKRK